MHTNDVITIDPANNTESNYEMIIKCLKSFGVNYTVQRPKKESGQRLRKKNGWNSYQKHMKNTTTLTQKQIITKYRNLKKNQNTFFNSTNPLQINTVKVKKEHLELEKEHLELEKKVKEYDVECLTTSMGNCYVIND